MPSVRPCCKHQTSTSNHYLRLCRKYKVDNVMNKVFFCQKYPEIQYLFPSLSQHFCASSGHEFPLNVIPSFGEQFSSLSQIIAIKFVWNLQITDAINAKIFSEGFCENFPSKIQKSVMAEHFLRVEILLS